jgi:hypothetical protein
MALRITPDNWRPRGYQQITSGFDAVQALTVPSDANLAILQIYTNDNDGAIRWRDDGTNPTSNVGMRFGTEPKLHDHENGQDDQFINTETMLYHGNLSAFRFIQDNGNTPDELNVSYYEVR